MNALVKVGDQAKALIGEIAGDLQSALPANMPLDRFRSTFIAAVSHTPELMEADPQTLKTALMKCAIDNLMPDGREATIQIYNTKVKRDGREEWIKAAQYMPMVQGIRKRAKELGRVKELICECVYEHDQHDIVLGDNPKIEHKPAPLGKPRGKIIGAYAIFKDEHGDILHREVMDIESIEKTRSVSKAKDGAAWTKFLSEMARKTVVRRGAKSVPSMPPELRTIIERDDDYVDLTASVPGRDPNYNPLLENGGVKQIADGRAVNEEAKPAGEPVETGEKPVNRSDTAAADSNAATADSNSPSDPADHGKANDDGGGPAPGGNSQGQGPSSTPDFGAFHRALARAQQHKSLATFKTQFLDQNAWTTDDAHKPTLAAVYAAHQARINGKDAEYMAEMKRLGLI